MLNNDPLLDPHVVAIFSTIFFTDILPTTSMATGIRRRCSTGRTVNAC
jgi:hypothetical protein